MQLTKAALSEETIQTLLTIYNDLNIICGMIGLDKTGKSKKYIRQAQKNLEKLVSPRCELERCIEAGDYPRDVYLHLRESLSNLEILKGESLPAQVWFMEKVHKPFASAFAAVCPEEAERLILTK